MTAQVHHKYGIIIKYPDVSGIALAILGVQGIPGTLWERVAESGARA